MNESIDFLESFEELKAELKEKWLDYYEDNREWIEKLGVYRDVNWHERSREHSHYFLLGVLSVLEPSLPKALLLFRQLNSDPKAITAMLGILNLNLKEELEKRTEARTQQAELIPLLPESKTQESKPENVNEI